MELTLEKLYIGGEWVEPLSTQTLPVISPATEEEIGSIPDASSADVDRAVEAAREAFDNGPWPRMTHHERAKILNRAADEMEKRTFEFAELLSAKMGIPIT